MRRWRQLITDTCGALAHKPAFQQATEGRPTRLPGPAGASCVPEQDRRRIAAYTVLAPYDTDQAASLLGEDGADRRVYGDASVVVDQTLSHVLDEGQKIVVEGAEEDVSGANGTATHERASTFRKPGASPGPIRERHLRWTPRVRRTTAGSTRSSGTVRPSTSKGTGGRSKW